MTASPRVRVSDLIERLIADGILTPLSLVGLLGDQRLSPSVNALEMAIVRENVMSREALLELKCELAGLPVYNGRDFGVTGALPAEVSLAAGALVLDRTPLTVVMVEDTPDNLTAVVQALGTAAFEVWLTTAPAFSELRRAAYEQGHLDERALAPDIFSILDMGLRMRASDIHLKVGVPPRLRVDGSMMTLDFQPLDQQWMLRQIDTLADERHLADLKRKFSADLAYTYGTARFRVNAATDAHGRTMVLRKLPSQIPTPDDIGLPEAIRKFAHLERGMVLVTGPTGSGKSTTLAVVLNEIIHSSARHLITLEDPIEFRFPTDRPSLVNQRELGSSFYSFEDGIRDALRQDPDVLLVGEMRDATTIRAALTAAETGHLVLATLHTIDAASSVARVVNSFPHEEQDAVRAQLAQMLRGIVSQTLLPRASTKGRVAAYEILVSTPAITTNLRKVGGENALKQTMQTSLRDGMCTMGMSLADLVTRGIVSKAEAEFRAPDIEEFHRQLAFYASRSG
jgi:twitching motility protein PilT